jgi:hypothetical protein
VLTLIQVGEGFNKTVRASEVSGASKLKQVSQLPAASRGWGTFQVNRTNVIKVNITL